MFTLISWFLWGSGVAFWGFVIWVLFGFQKDTLFTKTFKFLGLTVEINSQKKKDLNIKIKRTKDT